MFETPEIVNIELFYAKEKREKEKEKKKEFIVGRGAQIKSKDQ